MIFLKSLNLSKINAMKIELAISNIITNLTTKSARKKRLHSEKSEALIQLLALQYPVP